MSPFDIADLKKKIRSLKKVEIKIRFGSYNFRQGAEFILPPGKKLVWDSFFSMEESKAGTFGYNLKEIASMDESRYREIISEFYFRVYFKYYEENGINNFLFEPDILVQIGLPYDADADMIKKKFREIVKKIHPDKGGSHEEFVKYMEIYKKLGL